jgi:pimeloyl-ACP methyl ester carboxylesterase
VCSYDRAGLGWSDFSPRPRTSQEIAGELHALLYAAGVAGPYILVGHSFGGFNVRLYATRYPDEVAGVVLVNAGHEAFASRLPAACQVLVRSNSAFAKLMRPLTTLGVTRMAGALGLLDPVAGELLRRVPPEQLAELEALTFYRPQYWRTFSAEMEAIGQSEAQAAASGSLGDLPLVVVSGQPDIRQTPPGCSADVVREVSRALQVELTRLSAHSTLVVCDTCGHYIPMTDAGLAINAILDLAVATRR